MTCLTPSKLSNHMGVMKSLARAGRDGAGHAEPGPAPGRV